MWGAAQIPQRTGDQDRQGVALLPWLAVIAVIGILAAVLLPGLIRDIDFRVAREEEATLKGLGEALRSAIQRHAYIPSQDNWAEVVATEGGMALSSTVANARRLPRLLLIDTNGWFGRVSLPYTQTPAGSAIRPVNARMMIVSSLGKPLPLSAGPLSANEFEALWNALEGTSSFPRRGLWTGWNGRPDDVKVARLNLSSDFVSLYLTTYGSTNLGQYSIGTDTTLYTAPFYNSLVPPTPAYYLRGTTLRLYTHIGNLDSTQILNRNGSFMYTGVIWKSSAAGGVMPGGIDLAGAVFGFLNAVPNTRARYGADQQRLVVQAMMNYMSNYNAWAAGNFADANLKSYLVNTVQPQMISTMQDLFQGAYYPTNASGPQ